jgi:hypothetical protein
LEYLKPDITTWHIRSIPPEAVWLFGRSHAERVRQFAYPAWHGEDERDYERTVRGLFDQYLEELLREVRKQSAAMIRLKPLTKPERFEMLALYLCRDMSPEKIAEQPGFSKDPTGIYRDIRQAASMIGLSLKTRGRPAQRHA